MVLFAIATLATCLSPIQQATPLAIKAVRAPAEVAQFGVEELEVDLSATFENPFDPKEVALDGQVTGPRGYSAKIPGFYFQDYSKALVNGREELTPKGKPVWKLRICPPTAGEYSVTVTAKDASGQVSAFAKFKATPNSDPGFVKVSPRDHHYFEFQDGKPYFPIGANVCWAGPRGTFDYDTWFADYGKAGANYARLWLGPWWSTFALETPGSSTDGKGFGRIDLANAWKIDDVLRTARKNGLYLMLCIDSFNTLKGLGEHAAWDNSPVNKAKGGPIRSWGDFWTNPVVATGYRNKLRYLAARFGADSHVFAWEFWNEVDLVGDYQESTVREWHQKMAKELKAVDPYEHLITTSLGDSMGSRPIELLEDIDFVQTHHYGSADLAATVAYQESRKAAWAKPHYFGEIGASVSGPSDKVDPNGLQVHDPIWASIGAGCSGGAMCWFWDNLIAPKNLYSHYSAASKFLTGIDFPGEGFRPADITLAYADANLKPPARDLTFQGGPVSWKADPSNQPASVRVTNGVAKGDLPLAGIQHGIDFHHDLHNPVTFQVSLARPAKFTVVVNEVSNYGGATLKISLDRDVVLQKDFPVPAGLEGKADMSAYAGAYTIEVPAGSHQVKVENTGKDWFQGWYRFEKVVPRSTPPLAVWGVAGDRTFVAWVRHLDRSWANVCLLKDNPLPVPPTYMGLHGLASGTWRLEIWDTWAGRVTSTTTLRIGLDGKVRIPLPTIEKDVAVKMVRTGG